MNSEKYIGLDVHQATIGVAVTDSTGKLVMESSLCEISIPPRITRKSTRPRASDRSMVDTAQPYGLIRFETDRRRRY